MSETGFRIKSFGFPAYRKKLDSLGLSLDNMDAAYDEVEKVTKSAIKSYPPYGNWEQGEISFTRTRPGSKYKRTGDLGKGWKGRRQHTQKMYKYIVWHQHPTSGDYFPYVAGRNQSATHKPWWITIEEWPSKLQPVTLKIFQRHMKSIVARFK